MSGSKEPAKGTPLSVLVKTPSGSILTGVTIVAIGLRLEVSQPNLDNSGRPTDKHGRMDWNIKDDEFDAVADFDQKNKVTMPDGSAINAGECRINLNASLPGTNFGPVPPTGGAFTGGGLAQASIRFVKGGDAFGPKTPFVMTLVDGCLLSFADNPHDDIPARNLTLDQAREALVTLHKQGVIRIIPEPVFDFVGGKCAPAPKSPVLDPCTAALPCITLNGLIDGVKFSTNMSGAKSGVSGKFDSTVSHLDLRNAVGLVRLIQKLKARFQISEIHHAGIGRGQGKLTDCHNQGRAVDFVGVRVPPLPGVADSELIYVFEDWAKRSVPDASEIGTTPKTKPRKAKWPESDVNTKEIDVEVPDKTAPGGKKTVKKTVFDSFIIDRSRDVEFRLASLDRAALEAEDLPSLKLDLGKAGKDQAKIDKVNADHKAKVDALEASVDRARQFFGAMYVFIAEDYQDRTQDTTQGVFDPGPPEQNPISKIGTGSSIMNPDHHTSQPFGSGGREAHQAHLHFQIGLT